MSHYMTALAMKQMGLKPAAKIVLYWLADHYNQSTGECFPSHKRLAELCEMTDRSVRLHLDQLAEAGLIDVVKRTRDNGSQTSNSYHLKMRTDDDGRKIFPTPPENISTPPVQIFPTLNPVNNNHVNEQEERIGARAPVINQASEIFDCLAAWASEAAVKSFIEYRKKSKSKGLTLTAAKRLAGTLQEIFNAGENPDDALGLAEERGWQTVKADWYFQSQRTDRGTNRQGSGMAAAFATVAAECAARERYRAENPEDPNDTMLWGVDLG